MAYRRRYLSGQQATTVVIAEGAITSDKIVDGAVTHPKIAPGAVDSERVINESLKSEDIKDGEIKTPDIASGAITTDKIASQAVTVDKLEASIQGIARPLTPGVSTAEISDDAVVESKLATNSVGSDALKPGSVNAAALAGDAVETAKIKDAQITLAKMAPDSIDNTVIKANTIRGTEIAAGACGESELGTDSVVHAKIKDLNVVEAKINNLAVSTRTIAEDGVTEPKLDIAALSRRHKKSYFSRVKEFHDEFNGWGLSNEWVKSGESRGAVVLDLEEGVRIWTGALNGDDQRIDWGGNTLGLLSTYLPHMYVYIQGRGGLTTFLTQNIGMWKDVNNHIIFYAHDAVGGTPNWIARCMVGGVNTDVDTGVAVSDGIQLLSFEMLNAALVKFYINGIEKASINTNIPSAVSAAPRLEIITRQNNTRHFRVRYFSLLATRPALP